jgi:hypothetical protein
MTRRERKRKRKVKRQREREREDQKFLGEVRNFDKRLIFPMSAV